METRCPSWSRKHGIECLESCHPHLVFTLSGYVSPNPEKNVDRCLKMSIKKRHFPIGYFETGAGLVLGLTASEVEKLLCRR